jgi:Bacteriophage translational regulator
MQTTQRYYICHYKHLLLLNNKLVLLTRYDESMAHLVASKLVQWGLTTIIPNHLHGHQAELDSDFKLQVVQSKDKKNWKLIPKYIIGKRQFS